MENRNYFKVIKFLVSLSVCLCIINYPIISFAETIDTNLASETSKTNDIDTGIANLNYNNNEVLAVNGDKIDSFVPKEGTNSNDKFIVVERNKKSLTTSPVDISIIDSMANRSYPGALQLANQAFADNQPSLLVAKRKPLNISIDLPGMKRENTITVDNPT